VSDHVVGIDLGGSNVRVSLSHVSGRPVADLSDSTSRTDAEAVITQLADLSHEVTHTAAVDWSRVAAVAVALPGVVHGESNELRLAPNLPAFAGLDVERSLGQRLAVPVVVDNDVNMATLAEQRHGLGAGVSDFAFIAVGTGVGMGIVASGRLQRGATGAAGEIGFLPLGLDPFERANQLHGPLEEIAGGIGLTRRYSELTASPDLLSAQQVYELADTGDSAAQKVLDDQARAMALAVVSALSMLDPTLVVFGGGIGSREDFVAGVRSYVGRLTPRPVTITASELGDRAGLIGAVELACARANGQPRRHV
jgi:glucokinase